MSETTPDGANAAVRAPQRQEWPIWTAASVMRFVRTVDAWAESATDRAAVAEIILAVPDLCVSHEALRTDHAALTARLAAVEGERDVLREILHMISKLPCTVSSPGPCAACLAEAALQEPTDGG